MDDGFTKRDATSNEKWHSLGATVAPMVLIGRDSILNKNILLFLREQPVVVSCDQSKIFQDRFPEIVFLLKCISRQIVWR